MEETDRRTTNRNEQNRLRVQDHRWRHRREVKEKQAAEAYAKSPPALLQRQWQRNWEALPEEERATLAAADERVGAALSEIVACISGLSDGLQPGVSMPRPDVVYSDCAALPKCEFVQIVEVAAHLSAEDFDSFVDDEIFKRTGRLSKIPIVLFSELARLTLDWAKNNPGQCDPAVQRELEATVKSNFPPLIPATTRPAGVRQPTAVQDHKQHVATVRQLADRQRRSPHV